MSDFLHQPGVADAHLAPVDRGAGAAAGGEQFLAQGVVDHAVLEPAAVHHRDGDAEHREAVQEVGRAVQRVDDPDVLGIAAGAAFLGEEGVVRVAALHGADDVLLGHAVDFADEVVAALGVDLDGVELVDVADDEVAGAARGADADVQNGMHH
jgi:hypothetical protein